MSQEPQANGPGIVVLSSSLQVLHMNQRALELLNQLEHTGQGVGAERTVAAPLFQHCRDIIETLRTRLESNNREQFQLSRRIGNSSCPLLVKGFGLPASKDLSHSRIVMVPSPHIPVPMP